MENKDFWDIAFGLSKIDGEMPSDFITNLANREIAGEIDINDIEVELNKKNKVI